MTDRAAAERESPIGPKEVFGLLIRIGGGVSIYFAGSDLFYVFVKLLGWDMQSRLTLAGSVAATAYFAVIGLLLLRCADRIVAFAYREAKGPGAK